jgi:hypothetical protein
MRSGAKAWVGHETERR